MAAIAYPSTLPAPSLWGGQPFDRVARSPLPGNTQLRGRSRDAMQDIDAAWVYAAQEMTTWRAWFECELMDGTRFFSLASPGAGGWIDRAFKFRSNSLRRDPLGNGYFRISAKLQQRGMSAPPADRDTYGSRVVWASHFDGADGSTAIVEETGRVVTVSGATLRSAAAVFGTAGLRITPGTYISTPHTADLDLNDGQPHTICGWLVPRSMASVQSILSKRDDDAGAPGGNGYTLGFQPDGSWFVQTYVGGATPQALISSAGALALNTPAFLEYAFDGSTARLFANGALVASSGTFRIIGAHAVPLRIGLTYHTLATYYPATADFDDWRITKGAARHWRPHCPPTRAFPAP